MKADFSADISKAILVLQNGGLVGLPTETVYGLAADATNSLAVAKIFAAKARPKFNPLICHVSSLEMAMAYGDFDKTALLIAQSFWPAPLSIIVKRKNDLICDLANAGLATIAFRMPKHELALELITKFGKPLAAPSANISGSISPVCAQDVEKELGNKVDLVLDGGHCQIGLESTIISVFGGQISLLRKGFISPEEITIATKQEVLRPDLFNEKRPQSPGMLLKHYSPKSKVEINAKTCAKGEIFIGFGKLPENLAGEVLNLSTQANLIEAAANFYAILRAADEKSPLKIKIAPIPNHGLGEALNDRLIRMK